MSAIMRIEAKKMRQHIVAATPKAFFHSAPKWEILLQYLKKIPLHTDRSDSQLSRVITKNYSTTPRVPMGISGSAYDPQNLDFVVWCWTIKV